MQTANLRVNSHFLWPGLDYAWLAVLVALFSSLFSRLRSELKRGLVREGWRSAKNLTRPIRDTNSDHVLKKTEALNDSNDTFLTKLPTLISYPYN